MISSMLMDCNVVLVYTVILMLTVSRKVFLFHFSRFESCGKKKCKCFCFGFLKSVKCYLCSVVAVVVCDSAITLSLFYGLHFQKILINRKITAAKLIH